MTYEELFDELEERFILSANTERLLKQTVMVYIKELDEWYAVEKISVTTETDVLDEGHLYLETK